MSVMEKKYKFNWRRHHSAPPRFYKETLHEEGNNGSGGSSTVAIDNKIEQAMDLVKSHLMFAVREEVDVLKEQIKELLEKNQQLEQENNALKAAAPPEVLQQLSTQTQTQTQPPTSSS